LLRRQERTQIVSGEDGELEDIVPSADRKVQYHQNDQPKRQQKQVRRKHFCYPIPIHTAAISRYTVPKSIFKSAERFNSKYEKARANSILPVGECLDAGLSTRRECSCPSAALLLQK
jgi:hypothetical protein